MTPKSPTPPDHLRAATKRWWLSVVRAYELEDHHYRLLTLAAESWDRAQLARRILAKEGMTTFDRFKQIRPHPCIAVERDSQLRFARLLRELRLDEEQSDIPRIPRAGGRQ
ncbi:MAG: hypothetical protein A2V70_11325 [Planctomycetes bacterium RBG_13_63_9]|nr:MAG: hypothetical protein A2V70_11325 [Planctomycetes bacterium RBG_13_63_9]